MEEKITHFMLRENLQQSFNETQWTQITQQSPRQFINSQTKILTFLFASPDKYSKYFSIFYQNHLQLYHWYMLAVKHKVQIEPYLFKLILNRSTKFENQKLKSAMGQNTPIKMSNKFHKKVVSSSEVKSCTLHKYFSEQIESTIEAKSIFHLKHRSQKFDIHDLYLKTFSACNGRHYIYYDYEKHSKGNFQRQKYNKMCRLKKKGSQQLLVKQNLLSQFEEFKLKKEKSSLLNFNQVLSDGKINSERGLHNYLKDKQSRKLVFINHQRKPINYYLQAKEGSYNTLR